MQCNATDQIELDWNGLNWIWLKKKWMKNKIICGCTSIDVDAINVEQVDWLIDLCNVWSHVIGIVNLYEYLRSSLFRCCCCCVFFHVCFHCHYECFSILCGLFGLLSLVCWMRLFNLCLVLFTDELTQNNAFQYINFEKERETVTSKKNIK